MNETELVTESNTKFIFKVITDITTLKDDNDDVLVDTVEAFSAFILIKSKSCVVCGGMYPEIAFNGAPHKPGII